MANIKLFDAPSALHRECGSLSALSGQRKIKLPLKSVDIVANVVDCVAEVKVEQVFTNPHSEPIEAIYIFPLASGSVVSSFKMLVGDRVINGKVYERQVARETYAQAIEEGKRSALLELERDNVFTVQVANILPGESITVILTYSEKLSFLNDGTTEIRLPLVVAPRYIPGQPIPLDWGDGVESNTDLVPDASRITPPRLVDGVDPNLNLTIKVVIESESDIDDLSCTQHATKVRSSKNNLTVSLSRTDEIMNRDFVLRWCTAGPHLRSSFVVYKNDESDKQLYGMLSIAPPADTGSVKKARDVVFILDRSGSMQGEKMISAARACSYLLSTLTSQDRFAILAFDDSMEWLKARPENDRFLEANEAGIESGTKFLRSVEARGGTELDGAIRSALATVNNRLAQSERQAICVLLTDGQIGNESEILRHLSSHLNSARLFAVGIDTAVNDGFLKKLSSLGNGTAALVHPGAQLEDALAQISREIGEPIVQDIRIDCINCHPDTSTFSPKQIPDLFTGRPVSVFFKLDEMESEALAKIRITGRLADGAPFKDEIPAVFTQISAVPQIWAKSAIIDLEDRYRLALFSGTQEEQKKLEDEIVRVAVEHSILTKFTAFVTVDDSEIVNAEAVPKKLVQPVHNPASWSSLAVGRMPSPPMGQAANFAAGWGGASPMGQASNFAAGWEGASYGAPPEAVGFVADAVSAPPPARARRPGGEVGSYGSGVRAQVFEVIVRQGMEGAPWRQICAGPLQVNNISEEEVENEIARRRAASGGGKPTSDQTNSQSGYSALVPQPNLTNQIVKKVSEEIGSRLDQFSKLLRQCFSKISRGQLPEVDRLDDARTALLKSIVNSPVESQVHELQNYLRTDLFKYVASLSGITSVTKEIQSSSAEQEEKFKSVLENTRKALKLDERKPFWKLTV